MSSIEKSKPIVLFDEQQAQVNCLYTLCQAKSNQLTINGLSNDEMNYMIEFITSSLCIFLYPMCQFTILLCLHVLLLYPRLSNVLLSICVYTIVYK